jgi:transcription elongation factor Elf1
MQCPRCGEFEITFTDDYEKAYHRFMFLCNYCGLTYETPENVEGEETLEWAYNKFNEEYWNVTEEEYDSAVASGGGASAREESNDYECTVLCSFHGNVLTPLQYFSDLFNSEFWSGIELMQSVQLGCLSYPETEELLTGLFSDEIGNKKIHHQQFVKPLRKQKLLSVESRNVDVINFLNLISLNPEPTLEPKSDYYQPILMFVDNLIKAKKPCSKIIKETLDYIDTLIALQPHKHWGYKWFVTHREPERKGEKYKTLKDLQMNLKKMRGCNGLIEKLTVWLTETFASMEEYHYIYFLRPIETDSIFKIYPHPEAQPLQSLSGKSSARDSFNRGVSLILYPNTKLYAAFEAFCVEAEEFLIENNITKDDLYADFKTKEGSLISSPNMKLFCYWLMEKSTSTEEEKEEMREILSIVSHDFNLIDDYSITSLDIFKFIEIIDTCLKNGWGETKKIKVILSTCRVTDERMNFAVNPYTTETQDTQPDWNGGKRRKTRRKRSRATKKTRKHK